MKYDAILFDLDGTLVDSATDLLHTLNELLLTHHRPLMEMENIKPFISQGSAKLLELGFSGDYPMDVNELQQQYLSRYQEKNTVNTTFFTGIDKLLTAIEAADRPWGIVTNKHTAPTEPIIRHLQLDKRADAIVCGDTLPVAKPDPSPILLACKMMGTNPENCVYIGDAITDIQAGQNANMATIACAYGYIDEDEDLSSWNADVIAQTPQAILPLIH